ncbi:MAG TPA: O-methyltransferase [Ktedonobacterales bacterium]|nr:O-methyltransferase [Ktedonobacterales bacterium]
MQPSEAELRAAAQVRATIDREVTARYAPEDDVLRHANERAQQEGMPAIQISPLQGKLLQVLALSCGARKILEIGALAGYSGTWLARALPADGRMITLEVSPKHAEVARATYTEAGVADRIDIRVGPALESLSQLTGEAPFDLVFIDADKGNYPAYLDWAIRLSRPGSVIVADNLIRSGKVFQSPPPDADSAGLAEYTARATTDPILLSVAFPMDDDGTDGYAISVVRTV